MIIDIVSNEAWDRLNDELAKTVSPEQGAPRAYKGLAHALSEIVHGTSQFYSHKRAVGALKGMSYAPELVLPQYFREAYTVQILEYQQLVTKQVQAKEWVETLKKDTLFVIMAEDHPVTGEIFDLDEIEQALQDKRIYCIRVSHRAHLHSKLMLKPFSVRICSYTPDCAVAFVGSRFKTPSVFASHMHWDAEKFKNEIHTMTEKIYSNEQKVRTIESQFSPNKFLSDDKRRLWDRAILCFQDVSADALIHDLCQKLNIKVGTHWDQLDTTNHCSWNLFKLFGSWWQPNPKPEELRGLLVIGEKLLEKSDFVEALESSLQHIRKLQSWDSE